MVASEDASGFFGPAFRDEPVIDRKILNQRAERGSGEAALSPGRNSPTRALRYKPDESDLCDG